MSGKDTKNVGSKGPSHEHDDPSHECMSEAPNEKANSGSQNKNEKTKKVKDGEDKSKGTSGGGGSSRKSKP